MNLKRASLIALTALLLASIPMGLQAEPVKPSPNVFVRVLNQAELNTFFKAVCSANPSKVSAEPGDGLLAEIASLAEAECSTACCAHCTRCANTGEADDCSYCDRYCAKLE